VFLNLPLIYFGAIFIFPIRVILGLVLVSTNYLYLSYITWGYQEKDYVNFPLEVAEKVKKSCWIHNWAIARFVVGINYKDVKPEVDYTKYLGTSYETPEDYNTLVSNHSSYWDIMILLDICLPSFVSKGEIKKAPFYGFFTTVLRGIYLNRELGKDASKDVMR
jgi:hypothetical protein